jgi:hypothetical protein
MIEIEIIVFTRIGDTEFKEDYGSPITSSDGTKRMKIYNGLAFKGEAEDIANQIAKEIPDCTEALIVIHATDFVDISSKLHNIAEGRLWTIARYSTGDEETYQSVRAMLLANTADSVNAVYNHFAPNRILEAKLDLLHACLAPDSEVEYPALLKTTYLPAWSSFVKEVQEAEAPQKERQKDFSNDNDRFQNNEDNVGECSSQNKGGDDAQNEGGKVPALKIPREPPRLKPVLDPLSNEYVNALTRLRKSLLDS